METSIGSNAGDDPEETAMSRTSETPYERDG